MREFTGLQKIVQMNFRINILVRKLAPFLCRYFESEEGLSILKLVSPRRDAVVVDAGSNNGTSVSIISKYIKDVDIHCFDRLRPPRINRGTESRVFFLE